MKIPQSVRSLYHELLPNYKKVKELVDTRVNSQKEMRWHYESRIKGEESFALKLETGRMTEPAAPEDFFACTLVVENHSRITDAENAVMKWFGLHQRRPKDPNFTHLEPFSFDFDDLRVYARWIDDPAQKPTGVNGLLFEIQIKTFLQHAWGIATHDFVYKAEQVDWARSRIAYQVKAMLENAELSIGEARKLTESAMLNKVDKRYSELTKMIEEIRRRWEAASLPKDLRRLAQNFGDLSRVLRLKPGELWASLDEATTVGKGAKTLNLSPYGAILSALIEKRGEDLFKSLEHPNCRDTVFIPLEIDLPLLPDSIMKHIVRPPVIV